MKNTVPESPIRAFRKSLGLSIQDFARLIGVSSNGRVSEFENGKAEPTVQQALRLEELSKGRLDAAVLNADVAAARRRPACIDDTDDEGRWSTELAHTHTKRVEDYVPATAERPDRVVLCDACELDVASAEARACSYIDCPSAQIVDHAA